MEGIDKINAKKTVAVVSGFVGEHFSELLKGVSEYAREHGNYIVLRVLSSQLENRTYPFTGFDGIISDSMPRDETRKLAATGLPIVDLSGEMYDDPAFISVNCDIARIGKMAAERFLQRGFRNFAYYGVSGYNDCKALGEAFAAELAKAGFGCSVMRRDFTRQKETKKAFREWIANLPRRTAILCLNDSIAQTALTACLATGRKVPDDIAVMGTLNLISLCTCMPVTLSSIDINYRRLGYTAMRILASAIEHPVKPKIRPVFLVPPLGIVERESTAAYPVDPPWLAKALSLLDNNMGAALSVADLADAAGVSQPTLQAAIRKAFGMSAAKYIMSVKMREARQLIEEGKLSIKEIAHRTGFSSQGYFCCVYRDFFGRAPSECRGSGNG